MYVGGSGDYFKAILPFRQNGVNVRHCTLVSLTQQGPAVVSPPTPEEPTLHVADTTGTSAACPCFTTVVDFGSNFTSCYREPPRIMLTTDASLSGWGAHLHHHMTKGQWSPQERLQNIVAESHPPSPCPLQGPISREGRSGSQRGHHSQGSHQQNGGHSKSLMAEALRLGLWAETHLSSIRADHISGTANTQMDALSRNLMDQGEWSIPHPSFRR